MAHDLSQNLISAQYLLKLEQIDRISPNFIYAFILTTSIAWDSYMLFFAHLYQSYGH